MTYTYTINKELICQVKLDNVVIDASGPWESEASATHWAELYVEELTLGIEE
jgi:hypothetical protein